MKLPLLKILISLITIFLSASAVHSAKYFVYSSDAKTDDPFGVIEFDFGVDSTKVKQVTYLENETSEIHKEILQALLKASFLDRSKHYKNFVAKMNNIALRKSLGSFEFVTYVEKVRLKKLDNRDNWVLSVTGINKQMPSGDEEKLRVRFNLSHYTPKY